jgi:hypothetical protein
MYLYKHIFYEKMSLNTHFGIKRTGQVMDNNPNRYLFSTSSSITDSRTQITNVVQQSLSFTAKSILTNNLLSVLNFAIKRMHVMSLNALHQSQDPKRFDDNAYPEIHKAAQILFLFLGLVPTLAIAEESPVAAAKIINISNLIIQITSQFIQSDDRTYDGCLRFFSAIGNILTQADYAGVENYKPYLTQLGTLLATTPN